MKFCFPTWEESVKHDMYSFAKQVQKQRPKHVIIDCSDQEHPLTPELQAWAKQWVEEPVRNAGVQKVAIVRPANGSHWDTVEIEDANHRRYFDSVAEAEAWLKQY